MRVLTTQNALTTHLGKGRLEGGDLPVSIPTVERILCTTGTLPITLNEGGQVLDLGRETRLFTGRQRIALAARDGGCRWPGCDKPPAWTEAHHITPWAQGGNTDLADGVLLCRHHHMLLHNNHWNITRTSHEYWLTPPPDIDPGQRPRPLPTKSAALHDLQQESRQERERELRDRQRQPAGQHERHRERPGAGNQQERQPIHAL